MFTNRMNFHNFRLFASLERNRQFGCSGSKTYTSDVWTDEQMRCHICHIYSQTATKCNHELSPLFFCGHTMMEI